MSARLDAKFAFVAELRVYAQGAENVDSSRDILCGSSFYDAIGSDCLFLGRPKRRGRAIVADGHRVDDFGTQNVRKSGALGGHEYRQTQLELEAWRRLTQALLGLLLACAIISECDGRPAGGVAFATRSLSVRDEVP